jgi:uncharacterized membrane protein
MALLWILFAGTHVGLATRRVRGALVAALGEGGFVALFSTVAAVTYALLVGYYARHRLAGAAGLAMGTIAPLRWGLMAVIVIGVVLMVAGLLAYPRMPAALFAHPVAAPRGIERVTRHPFFAGVALFGMAHVLLATRAVGAVFAGGFVVLAVVGAWHQDRKLTARRGAAYEEYLAASSAQPYAAIAAGRQRLNRRDLPAGILVAGVVTAIALRLVHDRIFAAGGAWMVLAVLGGAALASWQAWRRAHRGAGRPAAIGLRASVP